MKPAERIDWDILMRFGMGVIGFGPTDFWQMTPVELEAAIKGRFGQLVDDTPMARDRLDALIQKFPDDEVLE